MKIIFLDIDGCLNGHEYDDLAQSCLIRKDCVTNFRKLLEQTSAKIVISSAWRYMVSRGAMTLKGFEYLLRTHGLNVTDRIIGITREDIDQTDKAERGQEISDWLKDHPEVTKYVVIDDNDFGLSKHPFVQTDGTKGITGEDVAKILTILGRG